MRKSTTILAALFLAVLVLKTPAAFGQTAATSTDGSPPTLMDVLQQLQNQIQILTSVVADLQAQVNELRSGYSSYTFPRLLQKGMSGDDVSRLQEILKDVPGIYPEGEVTGYFGLLTEAAVKRFQSKEKIAQTGVVGLETEVVLDKLSNVTSTADNGVIPQFSPVDLTTVPDLQNIGDISSLENFVYGNISGGVSDNAASSGSGNSSADLSGGYVAPSSGGGSAPPLPPAPPVISNIQASSTSKTSETILWTTNELATSNVYYSNDSTVSTTSTLVSDASFVTSHSILLSNLNNKTYYYFVSSAGSNGPISTSSILTFTASSH